MVLSQALTPFHVDGKGIDADLAEALARAPGATASPLPFPAGESMDDDLRNMVWRGPTVSATDRRT